MTEVLLFHHAQGLTPGVRAFAARLEGAGHTVHLPDLFEGRTFDTVADGVAFAQEIGFPQIVERGRVAAEALPRTLVYAGFSLGVLPAQMLAQTRPGAVGALLFESCVPPAEFGGEWPRDLPVQVHGMADDPFFAGEGDIDAARELIATASDGELFVYPGEKHLFADESLPSYTPEAATVLTERVLTFLAKVGA